MEIGLFLMPAHPPERSVLERGALHRDVAEARALERGVGEARAREAGVGLWQ